MLKLANLKFQIKKLITLIINKIKLNIKLINLHVYSLSSKTNLVIHLFL